MGILIRALDNFGYLVIWSALWIVGGIWIVRRAFNLHKGEQALIGLAAGLIIDNWLANILGQLLPVMSAFWLAAGLVFAAGLLVWLPFSKQKLRSLIQITISPWQWIALALMAGIFILIGRGLSLFDDYLTLPTTSLIASGDIPPHFALNPAIRYDYHYLVLLFSAQIWRIGSFHAWNSLDYGRGITFAISIVLTGLWAKRLTRSTMAGYLTGLLFIFGGGVRWLLLVLPQDFMQHVSWNVQMIGSALDTAPDLITALTRPWRIIGGPPIQFPFAFLSGISTTSLISFMGGAGGIIWMVPVLLILTHNRWRNWLAWVVSAIFLASFALTSEILFVYYAFGIALVAIIYAIAHKTIRLPKNIWIWLGIVLAAGLISLLQGGVITGTFFSTLMSDLGVDLAAPSYNSFSFYLTWPPKLVSQHLGILSLTNPLQLLVALAEVGPLILVLPLVVIWGIKAFRASRWFEAGWIFATMAGLVLVFIQYSGTGGIVPFDKWQSSIINLCKLYAVPLLWLWAKDRAEVWKPVLGTLFMVTILGGLVIFSIEMTAIPKPTYSYYIATLDARTEHDYWNKLPQGALIFDPDPNRSPVIFGRATDSSLSWYQNKPEWLKLFDAPNPTNLRAAGFSYVYLDLNYWNQIGPTFDQMLQSPCVHLVKEYTQDSPSYDFRQLLDIRDCK
ncbi:MAG: hypothetical protein P4L50_17155 [Anaerolineaceae bacterium]|nr:hypothetical protein [Anaerolineaceae bacterium]